MASKEIAIFHKTQWSKGEFSGSYATDNNTLVNQLKVLNADNFSSPVYSNWQENNILPEYTDINISGNNINLSVNKTDTEKTLSETEFAIVETGFVQSGIPKRLEYISLKFDWETFKTNFEEKCTIQFNDGANSIHNVILNNKSEINLYTSDGINENTNQVLDSSPDSIGSIDSLITNELTDWFVDVKLDYDSVSSMYYIETRLRSSGYESIWYRNLFGPNSILNLKIIQNANSNVNAIVQKRLTIKDILVEGYEETPSYKSQVFDSGELNTIWNNITINGNFPIESILTDETNSFKIIAKTSNEIESIDDTTTLKDFIIVPDVEEFTVIEDLIAEEEELTGRYLVLQIAPSINKNYQNEINYIKIDYTLPSTLKDYEQVEVTEASASATIGSLGGVIHLDTTYFPVKLYIPPDALSGDTTITIRRVPTSEGLFAEDIIGFEFNPSGLEFNIPVLLEVDYGNFSFNAYQNEEGLKLAYLDNIEPEQLDTLVNKNKKKAISYIEHFSHYGLIATDNLYSIRTANAATKHPRWMKIRDKYSNFQKILNHGAFVEVDKAHNLNYQILRNYFLDMADESMKFIAFKTYLKNFKADESIPIIEDTDRYIAKYKGKYIPITFSQADFYNSKEELCYLNIESNVIYFAQPYTVNELKIIDKQTNILYFLQEDLSEHKIWNVFDEFALLFDFERNSKEDNKSLKERILDYGNSPSDATKEGLINHIARELGIGKSEIKINSLNNNNYLDSLKNADGSASNKLKSITSYINNHLNIYWNQWIWDEGYWETNINNFGFIY